MSSRKRILNAGDSYTARDIQVLEGLEAVRNTPAMYIGGVNKAGLHHLIWELLDNSIDELMNGHATKIEVRLFSDGKTISVKDDGRGIPVDEHPEYKISALELLLTVLHSGGKFGGKNYAHAGGLHGVGMSVVNALSAYLKAEVHRDGKLCSQEFSKGKKTSEMTCTPAAKKVSGTTITFRPDAEIFTSGIVFDADVIRERLEISSYLHRGARISFRDDVSGSTNDYHHEGGIADYLKRILEDGGKSAINDGFFSYQESGAIKIEATFCWSAEGSEYVRSFANGIPTTMGGTHENAYKSAVLKAVRKYIEQYALQPKGLQIIPDDVRSGWTALISIYLGKPQFQGQTKDKLNNPEVQDAIESALLPAIEKWLNDNSRTARAIVDHIITTAQARVASKVATEGVRRQSTRRSALPGKLADCSLDDPSQCELFIVEGDSAGGSAKMGRDRKFQAILPLRGKVLNTEMSDSTKVLANKELTEIVHALGCGLGKDFSIDKLRYHKIILLMDADADGHHISTLLLTFFYRYMPALINGGFVYVAQPPLYRMAINKDVYWVLSDEEKAGIIARFPENTPVDIQRFKGLGEMMPAVLRETTLSPSRRALLRVQISDPLHADQVVSDLMGKDASARFRLIMERGADAEGVDAHA